MEESPHLERIPIEQCQEDPTQPRRTFDVLSQRRLQASVAKVGQLLPGHVHRLDDGTYRIDAGARRYRALLAAKEKDPDNPLFQSFWAIIGGTADDHRRVVVQWVSNEFRADVPPIEKARFVARICETYGKEIRTDLGLTDNDLRLCGQVATAPEWLQEFGVSQKYEVIDRDDSGLIRTDAQGHPGKKRLDKPALPLASLVRLIRHLNKVQKFLVERDGATKGEALTYEEVKRLAATAQKEEWSKRQLDEACNRSWRRLSQVRALQQTECFIDTEKRLSVDWRKLRRAQGEDVAALEGVLQAALDRVRAVLTQSPEQPEDIESELLSA